MLNDSVNYDEAVAAAKRKNNIGGCLEDVLGGIINPTNRNIAIEFECGGCCKKVLNGEDIDVIGNCVVLRPAANERLEVKLFSGGVLVERQRVRFIIIPIERICAIEFGARELD